MRIRLLIDVDVDQKEISTLAELIDEQVGTIVQIEGFRELGARFMGARPVETPVVHISR